MPSLVFFFFTGSITSQLFESIKFFRSTIALFVNSLTDEGMCRNLNSLALNPWIYETFDAILIYFFLSFLNLNSLALNRFSICDVASRQARASERGSGESMALIEIG
ncbi:unnamed protein product [Cuscuta europaea]|uniref:Uncharacterized protein n=1 Tax=Cuscuta europaea TaxID=41803 RepID=A0A9P1EAX1_CUSEU|nr:unnamed protein product [Cuscuta europaea]